MLFRYQHRRPHSQPGEQRSAVISWKGTWTRAMVSRLRPRVTDTWQAVARQQNSLRLTVIEEALNESDAAEIKSHGDALYYLKLSSPVIRPISLRQTRMEQMIREGAMASHENGNFFKVLRGEDTDIQCNFAPEYSPSLQLFRP
ncbi:putative F-box domain-containing protein [Seiridium cardinale]|uniref:F-box domain-containing protein n=1 Tax=Seiridium cardinale TaxID=138064 RepID=A0ABR2X6L4_9PEZI